MNNIERQKELAREAVKIIREYIDYTYVLGEEVYKSARANRLGSKITIVDSFEGKLVYELVDISDFLSRELRGYGPCPSSFYEGLGYIKDGLEDEINTMSKNEFIRYAGKIIYIEFIVEKMYKRLQEIEKEAKSLNI